MHFGQRSNLPFHLPIFDFSLEVVSDFLGQNSEIETSALRFYPCRSGEAKQVLDEMTHLPRRSFDEIKVLAVLLERRSCVSLQTIREAKNMPQRGPQIVRHRIAESFELFIGRFQLSRS